MTNSKFISGLKLNRMFCQDVVAPLMATYFPDLKYSAGLVGHGSDVLGFDSETSMDHNWGPHLHLFFSEADFIQTKHAVDIMLRKKLPYSYKGFSTNFSTGDIYRKKRPRLKKTGEINHLFEFWTPRSFFINYLGFDIEQKPTFKDWLTFPQQSLTEATAGELFHDDLAVEKVRKQFEYYPEDVWKYLMRVQWGKIIDELQIQARTGEYGDEVGSLVVTARNVQKIMLLTFLLERTYAPYSKWFGHAFSKLPLGKKLSPLLLDLLHEKNWEVRQKKLVKVYQILGRKHNSLNVTKRLTTKVTDYFGRGYPIINIWEYVEEIEKTIKNPELRTMRYPLGNVDQFIDHARLNNLDYFYTKLKNVLE